MTPPASAAPTVERVAFLNLPGTGNWQGASLAGGYWWAVEARKQADGSEDCYCYRAKDDPAKRADVTAWGKPMHINAGKGAKVHPTGWGVSDSGTFWLTANEGGNAVVTVDYQAGKVVTKAQTRVMDLFSKGAAQIAFDLDNVMASVRATTPTTDTHYLRTKQDILDGANKVLGTVKILRRDNRVVQGFTLAQHEGRWELRVLVGLKSAKSPFGVERWDAVTGKHIATVPLADTLGREPEGIDGDLVGFKDEKRQGIIIYRYTV